MTEPISDTALAQRVRAVLAVPLQSALGVHLRDADDPAAGVAFTVGGLASNGVGGLHSAVLTAVLEVAAYLALLPHLGVAEHAVSHHVARQLFAAAADGEVVTATAAVDRRTSRLAFLAVTASVGDTPISRAQITKSIVKLG